MTIGNYQYECVASSDIIRTQIFKKISELFQNVLVNSHIDTRIILNAI